MRKPSEPVTMKAQGATRSHQLDQASIGGKMQLIGEAVREALGTDNPTSVKDAVGDDREGTWLRVRDHYLALNRKEVPKKEPGEYVPAWFLEISVNGMPDTAGQYFVARALLYAHRVGMVDHLAYYCDEDIMNSNDFMRDHLDMWRGHPPRDMEDVLAKALLYLPLEKEGLLYYLTPPLHEDLPRNSDGWAVLPEVASDEELELYFKQYMSRWGMYRDPDWGNEVDVRLARYAAGVELGHTAIQLGRAVRFFNRWHESADLFTSGHPPYRDGIQFLMRLRGQTLFVGTPNADTRTLDALWNLPGFSESALRKLTLQNVLDMRDEMVFRRWRATLQAATAAYGARDAISSGEREFSDFLEVVKRAESDLLSSARARRSIENFLGDARDFGISVAIGTGGAGAGALLSDGELEPALVSGAVGVLASKLPALAAGVTDVAKSGRRVRAARQHMALFGS